LLIWNEVRIHLDAVEHLEIFVELKAWRRPVQTYSTSTHSSTNCASR